MSPMAFFFSASSTNTHCQPCELEPVGACSARLRHSISTSWLTGLSKSRRLRTERVVVRTSSTDRLRVMFGGYRQVMSVELTQEVSNRLTATAAAAGLVLLRRRRSVCVLNAAGGQGQVAGGAGCPGGI